MLLGCTFLRFTAYGFGVSELRDQGLGWRGCKMILLEFGVGRGFRIYLPRLVGKLICICIYIYVYVI